MDILRHASRSLSPYESPTRFFAIGFSAVGAFPIVCAAAMLAFWSRETFFALSIGIYAVAHLLFVAVGLARHRLASAAMLPTMLIALLVFGYCRYTQGVADHSPFSDGMGTVPQKTYGVVPYFREFEDPSGRFGARHLDWAALFANLELCVAGIVVCGAGLNLLQRMPTASVIKNAESAGTADDQAERQGRLVASQSPLGQATNPYHPPSAGMPPHD